MSASDIFGGGGGGGRRPQPVFIKPAEPDIKPKENLEQGISSVELSAEELRRRRGAGGTILTSPAGVLGGAPVQRKTLLGA